MENDEFLESNLMHSINGYVYGNLPGLDMCLGDRVAWHVYSMGTETDLHTLYFHGNVLDIRNHRRDAFSTSPAFFLSGMMDALNPGTWLMTSEVNNHFLAGSQMLYTVHSNCSAGIHTIEFQATNTREYYFQIEESLWDYAPTGEDGFDGTRLDDPDSSSYPFFVNNSERIGGTYKKARYFQYTNGNFTTRVNRSTSEQHLGFLGPIVRAEVGNEILLTLRNGASRNYSILPHGVMYDKANEGSGYEDGTDELDRADDAVAPGETYTYRWTIPNHYGPTERDEDCLTRLYYSAVDPERDVYSGLVGPLLVCRPGTLSDNGKRTDVFEFNLLLMTVDENRSWYIEENIDMFTTWNPDDALGDDDFMESNKMEAINGYSYANLPGLDELCLGGTVSWHLSALGGDTDQHTIYLRGGNNVIWDDRRTDTVSLTPGNSVTVPMVPENKGIWGIECMTGSHFTNGMKAIYTVHTGCTKTTKQKANSGTVRTYYIAAVETTWDYAPIKVDIVRNQSLLDEDSPGNIFVKQEGPFIGSNYRKALFHQYADDTFTVPITRDQNTLHFGILGPMITGEVGDQIKVVFKNNAIREYSMHPHGLLYNKSADQVLDASVPPGDTYVYTWDVTEDSGPSEGDRDCVLYAYYSDVNRVKDTHSGLVGPLVICKAGLLGTDGRRVDVDREFVLLFSVFDENQSWYLEDNIREFSPEPELVDRDDDDFQESNLMHGINGLLYGNSKHLNGYLGETIEWYLIGVGEEVDIHTVHFHGQPVTYQQWTKHRVDVVELFPGIFSTVQMLVKEVGKWLLHCHVNDHMLAGMETTYTISEFSVSSTVKQPEVTTKALEPAPTTESSAPSLFTYSTVLIFIANFVIVLISCTL